MKNVVLLLQVIIALGLLNVWLLRFHKPTPYRPETARSMPEEFAAYGLPRWFLWIVGALKVGSAICLLVGVWMPALVGPAAAVIAVLMIGAIVMHFKVHDPLVKSVPASLVLALTAFVLANAL